MNLRAGPLDELEHRTEAGRAAAVGRAVEIAGAIKDQAAFRASPVRRVAEAMQHVLRPSSARGGRQLEHRAAAVPPATSSAALAGGAVEIASGIEDQAPDGPGPVRTAAEVMQHLLRPGSARCGSQLEHRPAACRAAI